MNNLSYSMLLVAAIIPLVAATYTITNDGEKTIISNEPRPASEQVIKTYDFPDASDLEIYHTQQANEKIRMQNLLKDLTDKLNTLERLAAVLLASGQEEQVALGITIIQIINHTEEVMGK